MIGESKQLTEAHAEVSRLEELLAEAIAKAVRINAEESGEMDMLGEMAESYAVHSTIEVTNQVRKNVNA